MSSSHTRQEMVDAITTYFREGDRRDLVSILGDEFVLKVPRTLPYGGEYKGAKAFDEFVAGIQEGSDHWESFVTDIDHVIEAEDHLVAPIRISATAGGKKVEIENLWLFTIADGHILSAQIYADTAAASGLAS
jgi:ketosteroid isomerase-like protein